MRLPTQEQARYHGSRWFWVVGLAVLAYLAFPSSATNVAPMTVGKPADRDVVAPFTFPVNKSDEELAREAEELAATVKPIYQFQQRAVDSAKIAMHALFTSLESAADQGGGAAAIQQAAKTQGLPLSPPEAAYLTKGGKRHGLEKALTELFERTLALGVTGPGVLQVEQAPELIVRSRSGEQAVARDQVLSYAQYLRRARAVHPDKGSSVGDELYVRLEGHFFRPTLIRCRPSGAATTCAAASIRASTSCAAGIASWVRTRSSPAKRTRSWSRSTTSWCGAVRPPAARRAACSAPSCATR